MKTNKDADYNRAHTQERLKERYKIEINDIEYKELCDRMLTYQHTFIGTGDDSRVTALTWLQKKPVLLTYNEKTELVETALPPYTMVKFVTALHKHYYEK